MRSIILGLALLFTGCVSTTQYETDTSALKAELKVEKDKLTKTQYAVCTVVAQQCFLTIGVQSAMANQEVDPEKLNAFCGAQAVKCYEALSGTKLNKQGK